jgi:hypothetical protein
MRKMCVIIIIYECHGQKIVRGRPALSKNIDSLKFYFHLSIDMAIYVDKKMGIIEVPAVPTHQ